MNSLSMFCRAIPGSHWMLPLRRQGVRLRSLLLRQYASDPDCTLMLPYVRNGRRVAILYCGWEERFAGKPVLDSSGDESILREISSEWAKAFLVSTRPTASMNHHDGGGRFNVFRHKDIHV